MRYAIALIFLVNYAVFAAPNISSISGTVGDQNSLTINGTDFGTKSTAKPVLYTNFENNTLTPDSTLGQASAWTQTQNAQIDTESVL